MLAEEVLDKWNLVRDRLVACTTDSGGNIKKATITNLGVVWVYCMAHSMDNSLKCGINVERIKSLIHIAKKICTFFRRSSKAARVLAENQAALGLAVLKMKMYIHIRWNSAYEMIQRMTQSRLAVSATLTSIRGTRRPPS
jgi:deoxyhypusine synthase